jgi:hypothetical protein
MRANLTTCVAFWLASGAAACGSTWTVDLTLKVSARNQKDFGDYPAQLVLVTDRSSEARISGPEGHALHIANLCRASSSDFVMRLELEGDDCAEVPRFIQAWLEPREEGADSKCGELDEAKVLRGLRHVPDSTLSADTPVFEDFSNDCGGLHSAVTLELDW